MGGGSLTRTNDAPTKGQGNRKKGDATEERSEVTRAQGYKLQVSSHCRVSPMQEANKKTKTER